MGISIFPSTAAEFVSNNFVVDMNDTSNNTADTGGVKQAGPYSMSFSSGDTSFDVYLIDNDGNSVGYSNNTSIVASGLFTTVVVLGVAQDEVVSFLYQGSVNNADGEGDEPGAGAYLESISPSDLPSIDDTATVTGGNFGADTEIKFESGATVLDAKNITVNNSTELIVTRPDNLDADLDPWTLRAITTGVPEPTGTNANLLVDAVTAGDSPVWVTNSQLTSGTLNTVYAGATLEATDPDGQTVSYSITAGSLPTGLSLDSSTGVISGTPTGIGQTFTATATDSAGNETTREFDLPVIAASGGTVTVDGSSVIHTFDASDDFVADINLTISSVIIGGAGSGGAGRTGAFSGEYVQGGGGGGGGLLTTFAGDTGATSPDSITAGTYSITVGGADTDTIFSGIGTALAGGAGGGQAGAGIAQPGENGAAGGGGASAQNGDQTGGIGSNGGDGGTGGSFFNDGGAGGGGGPEGTNGVRGTAVGTGSTTSIRGTAETFCDGGAGGVGGTSGNSGSSGSGFDGANGAVIVRY